MQPTFKACFLLSLCLALCLFVAPAQAYPITLFDAKSLLERSDVVCYVKVVSVTPHQLPPDTLFSPPLRTPGAIARCQVSGTIKGQVPAQISIVFRKPAEMVDYTGLEEGEESLVFLTRAEQSLSSTPAFRFANAHDGKLHLSSHQPLTYKSSSPTDRMVAELIAASRRETGATQLLCVEQLGSFHSSVVVSQLRHLAARPDMALQGVASAALIRVGVVPQVASLSAFFKRQEDTKSLQRFNTTGYSNMHLKSRILRELLDRFESISARFDSEYTSDGSAKKQARQQAQDWKNFDLIPFLRVVIANVPTKQDDSSEVVYLRSIAEILAKQIDSAGRPASLRHTFRKGSRPLAIKLLSNANFEINWEAARAIDLMIAEKHDFNFDMDKSYVNAVRQWVRAHPHWAEQA